MCSSDLPGVVAGGIEFHVTQDNLIHIQVGVDYGFLVPHGFGNVMAARVDDAAAATAGCVIQFGNGCAFNQIGGVHVLGEILVYVEDVAAPFDGDVFDRILPFWVIVRIRCQIEADAFLVQGRPGQGHVIFPANEGTHGTPRCLDDGEICRRVMGIGPDIPFRPSRLDFPMMSCQSAIRCKDDVAAIEGIRRLVPFRNAQADIGPGGLGRSGYILQVLADDDGLVIIAFPVCPFSIRPAADSKSESQAIGITWDQRLGKNDELCPLLAGSFDLAGYFL